MISKVLGIINSVIGLVFGKRVCIWRGLPGNSFAILVGEKSISIDASVSAPLVGGSSGNNVAYIVSINNSNGVRLTAQERNHFLNTVEHFRDAWNDGAPIMFLFDVNVEVNKMVSTE